MKTFKVGQLEFDCRVAGEENKEVVFLLHGFPETSIMWVALMNKLASLGYYCIAPDMRGYSRNACPKGVKSYTVKLIYEDILSIADQVKANKFHLIGHDWGAAIGWNMVYTQPDRILTWTALSFPHSRAFAKAVKRDSEQKKKSRYIALFLLPKIPEFILRRNDLAKLRQLWKHCRTEELNDYLRVFRRKESLTGALNYYRANIGKNKGQYLGEIEVPTLFIWGNRDLAVGRTAAISNKKYMNSDYTFLEVEGGHWLLQTNYKEVESAVYIHLSKYKNNQSI